MSKYPNFQPLTLEHRSYIESLWKMFPPYSDYNFTSLYCWDTSSTTQVCLLNDNLVITMPDYITGEKIISFIGTSLVPETASTLLQYLINLGYTPTLKLIPEITAKMLINHTNLDVKEDVDNNDYILDAVQIANLKGNKWYAIKREVRKFIDNNNYHFTPIDLSDNCTRKQVLDLFDLWCLQKSQPTNDTNNERIALERSFVFSKDPDHCSFGLYVGDKMVGYSINQIVHNNFYVGHFGKADRNFQGAYQIIEHECAKFFLERGCKFMNFEQDLGIPTLRYAKRLWNPVGYLKKYIVKPTNHA